MTQVSSDTVIFWKSKATSFPSSLSRGKVFSTQPFIDVRDLKKGKIEHGIKQIQLWVPMDIRFSHMNLVLRGHFCSELKSSFKEQCCELAVSSNKSRFWQLYPYVEVMEMEGEGEKGRGGEGEGERGGLRINEGKRRWVESIKQKPVVRLMKKGVEESEVIQMSFLNSAFKWIQDELMKAGRVTLSLSHTLALRV